jgi:hypothetical protein
VNRDLLRHDRRIELPMRRIAEIELQRMRPRLEMDRVLGLRLAVVLVRRVVRNRSIVRRQLLGVDQEMVLSRVRRRVAGGRLRANRHSRILRNREAAGEQQRGDDDQPRCFHGDLLREMRGS